MLSIKQVEEELDACFEALHYREGEYPFETSGWRVEGVPSAMVVCFCERQSARGSLLRCAIFNNTEKVFQYDPVGYDDKTPSCVFAIQHQHAFHYSRAGQVTSHRTLKTPAKSTTYSCQLLQGARHILHG